MKDIKVCKSPFYNYIFRTSDGFFLRYGRDENDDPKFSPFGPELLDIEVSTVCDAKCTWCSPAGTLVKIKYGEKKIEDILIGDIVLGYDVKNKQVQEQTVKEVYHREYSGDLICIELENGAILKVTPEHGVFLKDGSIKCASDLTEGDDILEIKPI